MLTRYLQLDAFIPTQLSSLIRVTHRYDGTIILADKDELNFMHWNINSLFNKLHLVELRIASFPGTLHIIDISETRLTTGNVSTYQIAGYYAIHNVRHTNKGGGISIYIHESLCSVTPTVINNIVTTELHHFLVVKIPSINITIDIPNCMIIGDFNLDQLDIKKNSKLTNLFETHGFCLLNAINYAAITRRASGTILDLVVTKMLHFQYKVSVESIMGHLIMQWYTLQWTETKSFSQRMSSNRNLISTKQ